MPEVIVAVGPNIRQTRKCVRYYDRLCALLYQAAVSVLFEYVNQKIQNDYWMQYLRAIAAT